MQGLPKFFWVPPIISGTGKATNFNFCMHILSIDRNKSLLQISGKVAGCVVRTLKTFQGTHILGASRSLLCDSSAVLLLDVSVKCVMCVDVFKLCILSLLTQVCAIFIKATYFYICILWVCDHKSEHNRFRYIFKQQVISDKYVGRLGLAIVPWHRRPLLQTQVPFWKPTKK